MMQLMKAVCIQPSEGVKLVQVPRPVEAAAGHLLIKMNSAAINPGDLAFITRPLPPGSVRSLYSIYGASGAGEVIAAGDGVPGNYIGKNVSMYRSLKASTNMTGTWSEFTVMHYLDCVILPDIANPEDYSGSLVNMMTPYAFFKQAMADGHSGIICTAGSSATGVAMLGMSIAYNFPLILLVRSKESKDRLEKLGASHVIIVENGFGKQLKELSSVLETTAIFDGVGGSILNNMIEAIPNNSTIYSYGYLGDHEPLIVQMRTLTAKGLSIIPFGNFRTVTVQNQENLEIALKEFEAIIHMPHFKTPMGKRFKLAEITEALNFQSSDGGKAMLTFH